MALNEYAPVLFPLRFDHMSTNPRLCSLAYLSKKWDKSYAYKLVFTVESINFITKLNEK